MLTGNNGILTRADDARTKTIEAGAVEKVQLEVQGSRGTDGKINYGDLKTNLGKIEGIEGVPETITDASFPLTVKVDDVNVEIEKGGKVAKGMPIVTTPPTTAVSEPTKFKDTTSGNKIAVIPEGFRVSSVTGEKTEQSIDKGLVITDGTSEFVWVPVPDVIYDGTSTITTGVDLATVENPYTPMATTQDAGSGYYRGMLYEFDGSTSTYLADCNPETESEAREPDILEDPTDGDASTEGLNLLNSIVGIQGTIGTDNEKMLATWKKQLQDEYKEMVESVNKYKGFYVGRYETGKLNGNIVSKNASTDTNVITLDATTSKGNTWYGLYQKQKEYANGKNGIKSTMIWGSQYDAMMNWMAKQGKTVGKEDDSKYNNTTITGNKAEDNINNIFDLYGCHWECSIEASSTFSRVCRGGYYYDSIAPSDRNGDFPYDTFDNCGSRLTLFIQ